MRPRNRPPATSTIGPDNPTGMTSRPAFLERKMCSGMVEIAAKTPPRVPQYREATNI